MYLPRSTCLPLRKYIYFRTFLSPAMYLPVNTSLFASDIFIKCFRQLPLQCIYPLFTLISNILQHQHIYKLIFAYIGMCVCLQMLWLLHRSFLSRYTLILCPMGTCKISFRLYGNEQEMLTFSHRCGTISTCIGFCCCCYVLQVQLRSIFTSICSYMCNINT